MEKVKADEDELDESEHAEVRVFEKVKYVWIAGSIWILSLRLKGMTAEILGKSISNC
jgi:hypothetical protein